MTEGGDTKHAHFTTPYNYIVNGISDVREFQLSVQSLRKIQSSVSLVIHFWTLTPRE